MDQAWKRFVCIVVASGVLIWFDVAIRWLHHCEVANRKRVKQVVVRLSDDEYQSLIRLSEHDGLSISDWVRQVIRRSAAKLDSRSK